jgi:hypothetical protein
MTVAVLISGSLFKAPEERMSKAGRRFVSATLKVGGESGNAEFWSALAFGTTAGAELMRLGEGDKLAAQGALRLEIFNGKISRTVSAERAKAEDEAGAVAARNHHHHRNGS